MNQHGHNRLSPTVCCHMKLYYITIPAAIADSSGRSALFLIVNVQLQLMPVIIAMLGEVKALMDEFDFKPTFYQLLDLSGKEERE